jgi:hypothetical protein
MALGRGHSRKHLNSIAIDHQKIVFVTSKKELEPIEITQVHIMISIVGMVQKPLITVPIKFLFYVKQDVYQFIEYETEYLIAIILKKV